MNEHDMTETAYKNGYEAGKRDAVKHEGCKWCNGEYRTTILATAIRHHTNGNMDGYELKVNYCPNCGARMDGEDDG